MKKLLLFVLMLLPLVASADISGKCGDNVYYSYDGVTHTLTISGEGEMCCWDIEDFRWRPWHSFYNKIRSIVINPGVTSIGNWAFAEFVSLTSVTIPSSVTTIYDCAFVGCSGLTSVTIPNGVIMIEDDDWGGAFGNCTGLTSIIIPNSVTSVGRFNTFRGCKGLTSIQVESGNQKYDSRDNCNAIIETSSNTLISGCKNTIIPNSVTSIGDKAFSGCSGLTSITIPNSVISIGSGAFYGCSGLTKIISEIENPFSIVDNVFSCYDKDIYASATLIVPPGKKSVYQNTNGWKQFSNIVEAELIGYEFESSGIRYKIGENNTVSVTRANYSGDVVIPSSVVYHGKTYSVTSIGNNAFSGCRGLTSVTIPNSVTSIGGSAFFGCDYLTSVTIPNSVTTIGDMAFQECGLTSITIPNSVTRIGFEVFKLCSLTSVTIPNSVTSIGGDAFSECSGLTSVTIPSSVTSIAYTAFSDCRGLASIKVESGNEKYDSRNNCNAIIESASNTLITGCKNSTIPNDVTSIGRSAFYGCSGLTSVTIPNSVTSIGGSAFSYCDGLTTITSEIENPFEIEESVFGGIPSNATLIVPPGTKSAYQSKAGWNKFANIVEIEKNQTIHVATAGTLPDLIPDYEKYLIEELTLTGELNGTDLAFLREMAGRERQIWFNFDNFDIYDLEYGEGWSSETQGKLIDLDIFNANIVSGGNPSLRLIDIIVSNSRETKIYSSDNTIPAGLFHGCRLTSIKLPRNVSSIESLAFGNCPLTSIIIPSSVESIGRSAFFGCSSLTYALIGKGVTEISNALRNCPNLREMILSQTAFDNGIPESVTNYTTYSKNPMKVVVMSKGATSATLKIYPIDDNGNTDENHCYTVTMLGLKPGQNILWKLDDENYGMISEKTDFLTMEVQPAKPTSKIKARLLATVNELDDDLHFGFEWLRYDAPSNMTPNKVSAPLYEGQIVGSLNNLNPDVYYKYRPYYKSEDGSMFYGEWESFITGDADVFFEPETHTKDVVEVTSVSAQLAGVWIEGTEDIEEKGFEYWINSSGNTRAIGKDVNKVIVNGNMTTVVLEDLAIGTEYGYRSYMKTASCTTYGEEKTFKTSETAIDTDDVEGDVNGDGVVDDADLKDVVSHIMGNTPIGFNKNAADVNNDNKVNAADIVLINKIINKK